MSASLKLPVVDLSSPDRAAVAKLIREACLDHGFFYLTNHGIEASFFEQVFDESRKFFALPLHEKMKIQPDRDFSGYNPMFAETLDPSLKYKGDPKEMVHISPMGGSSSESINQWPSEERLPFWRSTMESYHEKVLNVSKRLVHLIALALDLDEQYFEKNGALNCPRAFVRLLRYPGELEASENGSCGASAHSDYGMITLLATDGVPGLQICKEKDKQPQVWEDVHPVDGAFIVNVGDMLERWTNCLFRSTMHRVITIGQERYSVAFFLNPNPDCLVKCLESCCSETSPPRFPPILSGDYLLQRFRATYSS